MKALSVAASLLLAGVTVSAEAAPPFRVASEDGRTWLAPGQLHGHPSVFLFWDTDCAPCLAEMHHLPMLRLVWPEAEFVVVSLSPRDATARTLAHYQVTPGVMRATGPIDSRGLLAKLGNRSGALPFSAVFSGDGKFCVTHLGVLTAKALRDMAANACR